MRLHARCSSDTTLRRHEHRSLLSPVVHTRARKSNCTLITYSSSVVCEPHESDDEITSPATLRALDAGYFLHILRYRFFVPSKRCLLPEITVAVLVARSLQTGIYDTGFRGLQLADPIPSTSFSKLSAFLNDNGEPGLVVGPCGDVLDFSNRQHGRWVQNLHGTTRRCEQHSNHLFPVPHGNDYASTVGDR